MMVYTMSLYYYKQKCDTAIIISYLFASDSLIWLIKGSFAVKPTDALTLIDSLNHSDLIMKFYKK